MAESNKTGQVISMDTDKAPSHLVSRRSFLKSSAVTTAGVSAGLLASGNFAYAAGSDMLRVGVVGCGGRGTGAARDAVVSAPGVQVVAMGDLFEDRLDQSREALGVEVGEAMNVDDAHAFIGFDAYRGVLESDIDIVILATPPGFRPLHFRAAVEAGKHVFMEKPVSVDVAGAHAIIEAGQVASDKGLSVVAGTLYRRQVSFVDAIERIHDGMIGEVVGAQAYYMTGPIWLRPRLPGMSDMEWQCRNWYYFTWLSGDHIVEQFVHNLDVLNWVFGGTPGSAVAMGGRSQRVEPSYGHIFDHFSVEYRYAAGARAEAKCRQMQGCTTLVTNRIVGSEGVAELHPRRSTIWSHSGEVLFERPEDPEENAYVTEHADLVESIRAGRPVNESRQIAESTLTAILGRESAYTGREIVWNELLAANLDLVPRSFSFGSMPVAAVPVPGVTELNRAPWGSSRPVPAPSSPETSDGGDTE
jgi:predicted dehydrogenase